MLNTFILVVHTLVAAALVAVILLQRSEGGALGIGSGPTGLLTARGATNLLTRATTVLATIFILTSITLAVLNGYDRRGRTIDPTLARPAATAPVQPAAPAAPIEQPADTVPLAQ